MLPIISSWLAAIRHIFIDHVPTLDYSKRNEAKRFIILIDVLYDNGNRLFLSAANAPDEIYRVPAGLKIGEFSRASFAPGANDQRTNG